MSRSEHMRAPGKSVVLDDDQAPRLRVEGITVRPIYTRPPIGWQIKRYALLLGFGWSPGSVWYLVLALVRAAVLILGLLAVFLVVDPR